MYVYIGIHIYTYIYKHVYNSKGMKLENLEEAIAQFGLEVPTPASLTPSPETWGVEYESTGFITRIVF